MSTSKARPARKSRKRANKKPSLPREQRPPRNVTRDLFLVWRSPRIGVSNPHQFSNPVWSWLARNPELSAYSANVHFNGPSSMLVGPCWSNQRFGQARVELPDGRTLAIGGEHEDSYDPDFYIYNDVAVHHPDGSVQIYGYSTDAFAPTDFHSATRVGDRVILVGNLGYSWLRKPEVTPVHVLHTDSFVMHRRDASGSTPGWISKHDAKLSPDGESMVVEGGERLVVIDDHQYFVENVDTWHLHLSTWTWTRLTEHPWQQWDVSREDRRTNRLFDISMLKYHFHGTGTFDLQQIERYKNLYGSLPDFTLYESLYRPPGAREEQASDSNYPRVLRVVVNGVTVRYIESISTLRVVIEGTLPQPTIDAIIDDLLRKFAALEESPCVRQRLQ
jgi:hypothetical protein